MPIAISPLVLADFPTLHSHATSPHGDLVAPAVPAFWPISEDVAPPSPAHTTRLRWSLAHQQHIFESDATAHFVKAVDTDSGEIVALARWHYYPTGYDRNLIWHEANWEAGPKPLEQITTDGMEGVAKEGLNVQGWVGFMKLLTTRETDLPGKPGTRACWVLTTLMTRPGFRKNGAGTKLVQWGCDKAAADGVPAYLEAGPMGKPLYAKLGFKEIGVLHVDSKPWGMDRDVVLSQMEWKAEAQVDKA